jgi:hypothetical protein
MKGELKMAVVVSIDELYPKHGVLATGEVIIDSGRRIRDVQLTRSLNSYSYKVILPKSARLIDSDLREKITDAMAYQYEAGGRKHSGRIGSEETILNNIKRRNYRATYLGTYKL